MWREGKARERYKNPNKEEKGRRAEEERRCSLGRVITGMRERDGYSDGKKVREREIEKLEWRLS